MWCTGPLLQSQLPPEVAARQAGRTLASVPSAGSWLLQLVPHSHQADSNGMPTAMGQQGAAGPEAPISFPSIKCHKYMIHVGCVEHYP
jgi:hypothetical protein